jgi:hypothetical protein
LNMIAASLAATPGAGSACAAGWRSVVHDHRGETLTTHQRGAEGAIDSVHTRPDGSTVLVDRQRP